MSDLKDTLERMRNDVSGERLPSSASVRRNSDRRRRRALLLIVSTTALVVAATAPLASREALDGRSDTAALANVASGPSGPSLERPWLPSPWRTILTQKTTLPSVAEKGDDFCGLTEAGANLAALRQDLANGDQEIRVYAIPTGSFDEAANLFKLLYAQCEARGNVSSEEGPSLYWQSATGTAKAALWDNMTVYLVTSVESRDNLETGNLRAVVAGLIDTVGEPCDATLAGTACPPR